MVADSSKLRLFIAVSLPQTLKHDLKRVTRHAVRGVNWSTIEQLHITLQFLGDTSKKHIPQLIEELSQIKAACFELKLNDCGFFPGYEQPKVFWMGLNESPALGDLYQQIQDVIDGMKLKPDSKPFMPHLTLARLKKEFHPRRSNAHILSLAEPFMDRTFEVDAFHLYSSALSDTGSVHTCLHTVPCFDA